VIDGRGYGVFPVSARSVSVWVDAAAEGRDRFGDLYVSIFFLLHPCMTALTSAPVTRISTSTSCLALQITAFCLPLQILERVLHIIATAPAFYIQAAQVRKKGRRASLWRNFSVSREIMCTDYSTDYKIPKQLALISFRPTYWDQCSHGPWYLTADYCLRTNNRTSNWKREAIEWSYAVGFSYRLTPSKSVALRP